MDKTPMSPVAKGLIVSAILVIFSIIIIKLGQDANPDFSIIPVGILLLSTLFGSLYFAKQMNGNVSFQTVFTHGFKMTALIAAMVGLWIAVSLKFNILGVMDHALQSAKLSLEKIGSLKQDEIDEHLKDYKNGAAPLSAIMNVVLYLFIGAIGSAIGAVFSKKNPNYIPVQKD